MELIRTSLLTATSTAIKLASAFAINKVVAVVAGPAGMALVGQVQNVATMLQGISSGLFGTAAVKHTAEWSEQPGRRDAFLSLSYTLCVWITVAVGLVTGLLSWWLAKILLNNHDYWWVFALLGVSIPLFATNSLILSVINGLGDIRKLTLFNVGQSICGLVLSIGLPLTFGLSGVLAATVLASSVVFVLLLPELRRHAWLKLRPVRLAAERDNLKRLSQFALMALITAICAPLSQLVVREWMLEHCSAVEAGYWQAVNRLSGAYLAFFTTTLAVYYLPKFASQSNRQVKAEIWQALFILWPVILALLATVWMFREWVVMTLFSMEFLPMTDIMHYQIVGDFLKLNSWILGSLLLARGAVGWIIGSEVITGAVFILAAINLMGEDGSGGSLGATKAHALQYAVHLVLALLAALLGATKKI